MEDEHLRLPFEDSGYYREELREICQGGNFHSFPLSYCDMEVFNIETHWEDMRTFFKHEDGTHWFVEWRRGRGKHQENQYEIAMCWIGDDRTPCLDLQPAVTEEVTTIQYKPKEIK